jgi:hypothetical protein
MIKFIVAYDDKDAILGTYFEDCKNDIVHLLKEHGYAYHEISNRSCNSTYIDIVIPTINSNPFIFIAYTHGVDDGLICNEGAFISIDNCYHFCNSLFYSNACLIGKRLAQELINKGCKVFIGFKEESKVLYENDIYRKTFIECDNYALKMFITSDTTIGQSFEAMINYYTNKIDRALELREDTLYISVLRENRDALICLGNTNLKKEDLFLPQ